MSNQTAIPAGQVCPNCGCGCSRDEADIGVGIMYGPWGCPCGWSEDPCYDVRGGARVERGHAIDQWGGLIPAPDTAEGAARDV